MNKRDLMEALTKNQVRDDAYDLCGGHLFETYTLSESYGKWYVYYSERGLETNKKEFESESEACEYMYRIIINDLNAQK